MLFRSVVVVVVVVVCCVSGVSHIQFCSRGHVSSMSVAWLSLALGRAHGVFFPDVFFLLFPVVIRGIWLVVSTIQNEDLTIYDPSNNIFDSNI